ncbi:MAG: DUF433 domain-containing protein [Acidobacteriota bacterium]
MPINVAKKARTALGRLVCENINGYEQQYYPLGEYVVVQPQVCGGRPTIKYTRMTASAILAALKRGESIHQIALETGIPAEAIAEVERLAADYDYEQSYA